MFRVNDEWFALPSRCLHEIAEKRSIHRIPRNKNTDIRGVVNISGEVRICYSLKSILGVKDSSKAGSKSNDITAGRFIVTILNDEYYVFDVEQVNGLSLYSENEVLPVPATLQYSGGNMISAVINQNKNNIAVLDIDKFQRNLEGISL